MKITKNYFIQKIAKITYRLLFIFFSQDIGLIPINSIEKIIKKFFILKD